MKQRILDFLDSWKYGFTSIRISEYLQLPLENVEDALTALLEKAEIIRDIRPSGVTLFRKK